MKAICINNVIGNKTYNLTIGKIYEVQLVKNSFIPDNNPLCWKCINDFMVMTIMPIDTFSEIDRYRNQRINLLLK